MKTKDPFYYFICLIAACFVFAAFPVYAGGDDIEQNVKVITGDSVLTGGDNIAENAANIGGSRSYSVGMGSIDVDIAQCLGSESTGVLVFQWQRLKENPWCMADTLDAKGLHEAAARARCSVETYLSLFQSKDECLSLSTAVMYDQPPIEDTQPSLSPVKESQEEDDHTELEARIAAIEAKAVRDAEAARRSAHKAAQAAQQAQEANRLRREYAQQTLDQLKEYQK